VKEQKMKSTILIGVTQRMFIAPPHGEARDCLARDWYLFLRGLGLHFVVLPNDAEIALATAGRFDIGAVIFTGGDDIGAFPQRDAAEESLFSWAREHCRPVVGVCRGFQMMCRCLRGACSPDVGLVPVDPARHVAKRHEIVFTDSARREVNSFHRLVPAGLPDTLRPLARCAADDALEAALGDGLLGLMWHPERERVPNQEDLHLFKQCFGL
jgi:putative glutamine amidotransferase